MSKDGSASTVGDDGLVAAGLERLGIIVPSGDIAFLRRAIERQRELLRLCNESVPADTEPAHVFRVLP